MKSKLFFPLALLSIFLSAGYFQGCERENNLSTKSETQPLELQSIVSAFNANRPQPSWTSVKIADVKVINSEKGIVYFRCDVEGQEQYTTFFIQTNASIHAIPVELGRCEVLFLETELLIHSLDNELIISARLDAMDTHYLSAIKADQLISGYGLGLRMESRGISNRVGPECRCEPTTIGDSDCESGGHGSTSCSVTIASGSCSVNCSAGYFACCDHEGGD